MITAFVTFRYGEDFSAAKVRRLAESARARFEGMPELAQNYSAFLLSCGKRAMCTFGTTLRAPRRFFTAENRDCIAALYGVQPIIEYAEVCAFV